MKKLFVILVMTLPRLLGAQSLLPVDVPPLPPQATLVEDVLVPIPSEIFGTLDHFADSNWQRVQRLELARSRPGNDQAQTALRLGAVIAEGFIAVEAQDAVEVKDVGKTVLTLALALGVEKSVLRRSNSIIDHAEKRQWESVRKEWSAVNADVKAAMVKLRSEQISQLVSFGGWLRGTEALTGVVLQHYSPENAALLRQPAVLDHFEARLERMSDKLKKDSVVARSPNIILTLRQLSGPPEGAPILRAKVESIRTTVTEAVDAIQVKAR